MTIKCFEKCGQICQRSIGTTLLAMVFVFLYLALAGSVPNNGQDTQHITNPQLYAKLDEKGNDLTDKATALNKLALRYHAAGEYGKAKPLYEQALAIDEKLYGDDHHIKSIRLNNLAELYCAMGEYDRAKPLYERALAVALKSGHRELLWRVQFNLSYLLAKQGKPDAAIFFGKRALNTIQELRTSFSHTEIDIEKSFLKTKWYGYKFLASLLIDQGRITEAQQVLDMKKEEEYLEFRKLLLR